MESKSQKRLLILGSQFELTRLVRCARERGYYTVVCDGYADGPARAYADKAYTEDVRSIDRIAQICMDEQIDHIITSFSDIMFECMVRIADRAGLPCYIAPDMLDAYRRKDVTKAICRKIGIKVPRFVLLNQGFQDAQIEGFRFPAIIKPNDSYGSRGLTVVRDAEHLRRVFRQSAAFSSGDEALLEEISRGQELNCMAFVVDGTVKMISISDRMTAPYDPERIPINYGQHYPSDRFDAAAPLVEEALQKYIEVTGQKWGPISTQCFYDGENIEICEIAGRMFGFEHELVTYTTGLDVERLLLDLEYDQEQVKRTMAAHHPKGLRHACGIYLTSIKEGIVADQSGLREAAKLPFVREHVLFYADGEHCEAFGPKPYFARYYLVGDQRSEVREAEKQVLERVSAKDEAGEELLFIPRI